MNVVLGEVGSTVNDGFCTANSSASDNIKYLSLGLDNTNYNIFNISNLPLIAFCFPGLFTLLTACFFNLNNLYLLKPLPVN